MALQDAVPSRAFGGAAEIRPDLDGLDLRLGADFRLADGETREFFSFVAGAPTRRRVAGGETLTTGAFAELAADLGPLTLSGGVRLDRWSIAGGGLREWVIATAAPLRDEAYATRSGWRPTARAGAWK